MFPGDPRTFGTENCSREPAPLSPENRASSSTAPRWPSPHTRDWLASFLERAEADKNVVAVIVIGSAIRPEVASDDLDVMVLCRDVARLREKAPIEIDLRKADLDGVEEKIRAGHDLLIWAVRFGRRSLLDRDGAWASITRRWTNRLPVPDPAVAKWNGGGGGAKTDGENARDRRRRGVR